MQRIVHTFCLAFVCLWLGVLRLSFRAKRLDAYGDELRPTIRIKWPWDG